MFSNRYKRYLKKNIYIISDNAVQFNYFKSLDITKEHNIIHIDNLADFIDFLELDDTILSAEDKTYIFSYLELPSDIQNLISDLVDYLNELPSIIIEYFDDSYIDTKLEGNFSNSVKVISIMDFEEDITSESYTKLENERSKVLGNSNDNNYDDYLELNFEDADRTNNDLTTDIIGEIKDFNLNDINFNDDDFDDSKFNDIDFDDSEFNDIDFNDIDFNDTEFNNDDFDDTNFNEPDFNDTDINFNIDDVVSNPTVTIEPNNTLSSSSEIVSLSYHNDLINKYESEKYKLEKELSNYLETIKSLKDNLLKINNENSELKSHLSDLEVELRTKVNFDLVNTDRDKNLVLELTSKENLISTLEKELKNLRRKNNDLETEISGSKVLHKEQFLENKRLSLEIENLQSKIVEIKNSHSELLNDYILKSEYDSLLKSVESNNLLILDLQNQIQLLKTDVSKGELQKELLKEEFINLENLYKAVLTSETVEKPTDFNELNLSDDVMTNVLYFKMISRPSYFGSFYRSLKDLLSKTGKVLTLIICEENYQTSYLYPDVPIINEFDSVRNYESDVFLLKPSQYMLSCDETLFSVFDSIIVLDYSNTKKVLIKGINVFTIYTCINEKECELLGLKGPKLCNIGNSVVDIKYDNKFELAAKTPFARKAFIDKKVRVWLNNLGIKVK